MIRNVESLLDIKNNNYTHFQNELIFTETLESLYCLLYKYYTR